MDAKRDDKSQARKSKQPKVNFVVIAITLLLLVLLIVHLTSPTRSVAAYCKVYKEEKLRLSKLPGGTYPSGVFNDAISDAGEFAISFRRLDKVAPDEIHPDVSTLQSVYQKMHDDPAQAMGASLSGASADSSVKKWTTNNCKINP